MENYNIENINVFSELVSMLAVLVGIFILTAVTYFCLQFLFKINLIFKKNKIKKLSKKYELNNYNLRLNAKGMPVMFVHKIDSSDIIII